jgi:hypothetical protein
MTLNLVWLRFTRCISFKKKDYAKQFIQVIICSCVQFFNSNPELILEFISKYTD